MSSTIEIFLCYARKDEALLKELEIHLGALRRQNFFDVWHDREIMPGKETAREIDKHLNTAQIILLLVSHHFMNSDYCYLDQMQRAIERHECGEARVIPIILRPVYWERAPFAKLQPLPTDAEPATSSCWHSLDEAFFNIAEGIRKAVEEMNTKLSNNSPMIPAQLPRLEQASLAIKPNSLLHVESTQVVKIAKSIEAKSQQFKVGDKVNHHKFGKGIVSKSEIGDFNGKYTEFVEVQFQGGVGKKRLLVEQANLEKL